MHKITALFILLPLLAYCQTEVKKSVYPDMVGDIAFDAATDKKDFQLCDPPYVYQYFNFSEGFIYKGEKIALDRIFREQYHPENAKKESGTLRIRFIVNCKGETDRFRIIGMDENYTEKIFDASITNQLLTITKELKGWPSKTIQDRGFNYYQYLIFKIENGQLIEILP